MTKFVAFLFVILFGLPAVVQAKEIKAAAVEFAAKSPGFDVNLPGIVDAITVAARNGAKLIVLPEGATTGFLTQMQSRLCLMPILSPVRLQPQSSRLLSNTMFMWWWV